MASKEFVAKHGLDIGNSKLLLSNTSASTKGQFPVYDGTGILTWRKISAGTGITIDMDTNVGEIKLSTTGQIDNIISLADANIGGIVYNGANKLYLNYVLLPSPTTPTDASADGGGFVLRGTTDKTILWNNTTDQWNFNQGINITGAVQLTDNFIRPAFTNIGATTLMAGLAIQRGSRGNDAYIVWDEAGAQWRSGLATTDGNETAFTNTNFAASVLVSTVATGTAPLTVSSTTQVANLNASQLVGNTWAVPGTIGSTTPNTGTFTTLTVNTDLNAPYVDFATAGATGAVARLAWNNTDGTLEVGMGGGNVTQQIGQENLQKVANRTAGDLLNGKVVRIVGSYGSRPSVDYAQANSEATSTNTYGVLTETITTLTEGFVTTFGYVRGLDTSGLTEGAQIYLSPTVAGGLTSTKPTAPNHMVKVGWCVRANAVDGIILVNVMNGVETDELHDVKYTTLANNDLFTYDSTNLYWKNSQSFTLTGISSITNNGVTDTLTLANSNTGGNALKVTGNALVTANLRIQGNLQVDGTTTTVNSTTITIDDPIFTLGGDTAPTADDNKDRGIEFRWHNGTVAKTGFFGFDDSTGEFAFIPDGTNTAEVYSGTDGSIRALTLKSTVATGIAPLSITSTTLVTNLNADLLDGQEGTYYRNATNINAGTLSVSYGGTGGTSQITAQQGLGIVGANNAAKTGAYTVLAADRGLMFVCTNSWTLSITAAATLGNGFAFAVVNNGLGTIVIDPNASELIDGATTKSLLPTQTCIVVCDGTGFYTIGLSTSVTAVGAGATTSVSTTTPTAVASYSTTLYRSAEIICQIVDTTNTQYHSAKIFLFHDGTNVWLSEYSVIHSVNELGTFDADISGGNVRLLFTPTAATNKTIKTTTITMNA